MPSKPQTEKRFNEYVAVLRETSQGEFTIVSFKSISLPARSNLVVPMKRNPLRVREVLVRGNQ